MSNRRGAVAVLTAGFVCLALGFTALVTYALITWVESQPAMVGQSMVLPSTLDLYLEGGIVLSAVGVVLTILGFND